MTWLWFIQKGWWRNSLKMPEFSTELIFCMLLLNGLLTSSLGDCFLLYL